MKKDHLDKQQRKQIKQDRQARKNARGRSWSDGLPVAKIIY